MKDTQIKNNKLITITRNDLNIASQAVQAGHAAIQFQHEYPEISKNWIETSNYLVYLAVKTEKELWGLKRKAESFGLKVTSFTEPDFGDVLTAITLEPCIKSRKLTSSIPLLGKGVSNV